MSKKTHEGRSVFKRPVHNLFLRRWLCGVVALTLALPEPAFSSEVPREKAPVIFTAPSALQLPTSIGRVEETFSADKTDGPAVYLIQDAHAVYDAQKNITEIIHHLRKHSGVTSVAFEGGSGEMDAAVLRAIPDGFLKEKILDEFMRRGELSGTARAAAEDDGSAVYAGLEDWPLYEKNYVAYLAAQDAKPQALDAAARAGLALDETRARVYPPDLERLHTARSAEMSGQNFAALARTLGELAARVPFEGADQKRTLYPELARFLEASSEIRDPDRADHFARGFGKKFLESHAARLSQEARSEFNHRWQAFVTGQEDFVFFFSFLRRFSQRENIKLEFPAFVQGWAEQADTLTSLEGSRLMAETEALADALETALAVTPAQKAMAASYRSLVRLQKLASLELSSSEYEKIQESQLRDFDVLKPGEPELFSAALDFYAWAARRDSVFLKELEKRLSKNPSSSTAVVIGGFHREALTAGLRARGIPHAVLTPNVDSLEGAEYYGKVMLGEISYASRLNDSFYEAFMFEAAARAAALNGGNRAGPFAREWRDNLLRDLASRGRLADADDYIVFVQRAFSAESEVSASASGRFDEGIRRVLDEFRRSIEKSILDRFELQLGQRPGLLTEKGAVQTANADSSARSAGFALNASAGVDILIPASPARADSPVLRAVREGWRGVLPGRSAALPASMSGARSELRSASSDGAEEKRFSTLSGIDFTKTAPVYRTDNEFAAAAAQKAQKTLAEIRRDVSDRAFSDHERMRLEHGFLSRESSPQARVVYEIFDQVVEGYNRVAAEQGYPLYTGKLFLVDSPDINAFVHSEHPDVYFYSGLLRDLERYAAKKNMTLTHEFVAGILAHELSHVMQNSAYEGIDYSTFQYDNLLHQEMLVMKRNAEYDADRSAIHILTNAGYSPKIFTDLLQFLADITAESTAEHAFSDHPHPSLRISEIMRIFNDSKLITLSWDEPLRPFAPEESFLAMPSSHWTELEKAETLADLTALEDKADSLQKVLELGHAAGERAGLSRVKAMGLEPRMKSFFSKSLLAYNALALAREVYNQAVDEKSPHNRFPVSETGMTLQSPAYDAGDLELLGFEPFPLDPETERGRRKIVPDENRFFEEMMRELGSILHSVNQSAKEGDSMHPRKAAALAAIRDIARAFRRGYESGTAPEFDAQLSPLSLKDEAENLIEGRTEEVLDRMMKVPFSVYMNFGRTDLNVQRELMFEEYRLGGINLEINHAGLYREALEFMPIDTPERRKTALNTAFYSWLYDRESDHQGGRAVKMLERLSERARNLIRELPPSELTGDAAEDARRLEDLRADTAVFVRSGNFPRQEDRLLRLMKILTSPSAAEGPAVLPSTAMLRSPIFERETGLGVFSGEKSTRVSEVFQHQDRYLEISGDARRAAEILAEDFRREDALLPGDSDEKIDVRAVLRRNLADYSPFFRKAIIREFLLYLGPQKSLYPSLPPARYRHADVYEGFKDMLGPADGHAWMAAFMKIRRAKGFEKNAFADPAHEKAFLEDYASFFENTLLPDRADSSFMIDAKLAAAFLEAKFELMEAQGLRADDLGGQEVFRILDLLSRHTLLRIETGPVGKAVADADHEPRLGNIGISRIDAVEFDVSGREDMPAGFFSTPENLTAQTFFRRFLNLPLSDLKQIARNQEHLLAAAADTPRRIKGRFVLKTYTDDEAQRFLHQINHLMIRALLIQGGESAEELDKGLYTGQGRLEEKTIFPVQINTAIMFRLYLGGYGETARLIGKVFARNPDFDRSAFWKELSEVFIRHNSGVENEDNYTNDSSNMLFKTLFEHNMRQRSEPIESFVDVAALMDEVYLSLSVREPGYSYEPVSYLKALGQQATDHGFKQELFKQFVLATKQGPRSFVDIRRRPAAEILEDLSTNFLTAPSLFRDGFIDILERQIFPEIHAGSALTDKDWDMVLKGSVNGLEWFISRSLTEIPVEWMNLSENFPSRIGLDRISKLLAFYDQAIPVLADPQRQLRFGAAAIKLWRVQNPKGSFREELEAVQKYFPHPTKLRDEALEELFNRHELPSEDVSYADLQKARGLYSIYHRMLFEHEATNADAAFQAVQSMLTSASRRDRMHTALWILNPDHPMPEPFLRAKQEKNILFDDLPKDLRFAPEFLKTDMLMNLLTGENGILNPRTAEDRAVSREFLANVFEHFFPTQGNNPAETGLTNEALNLLRDMFVFALDHYDQGRGASIIDTLRGLESTLARKTYGERLAVLLGSLGPVGVKIGQILSENQELVPDARLRRDLSSLKHGVQSISKIAVIDALIAAGFSPHEFRVGELLGSASMKQVHGGHLLINGEWKEVVFKVLRPALNRTIDQDLRVLELMFGEPGILAQIRRLVPAFEPGEIMRKIRFMIDEERDFLKEADNSRVLAEVVETYPETMYQVRGLKAGMPKIFRELTTVIVEERVRGLEAEVLVHRGLFGRKARAKAAKIGLSPEETRRILSIPRGRLLRLARNHFFHQVFTRGIFHADPHAGNLMVEDGRLIFIDAGLIGRLILPEQVEAARLLVRGVMLWNPEDVYEGVRRIFEAGGEELQSAEEFRAGIHQIFRTSNLGNLNKLLNELGALIARQPGAASAQAGAFIKAWTQSLWLMPMTPATLSDLAGLLNLTGREQLRAAVMTGAPNLFLQPFRAMRQLISRAVSFFQDALHTVRQKIYLYRASLRLRVFQDNLKSLVGDFINAVEEKARPEDDLKKQISDGQNIFIRPDMPLTVAGEVYNDGREAVAAWIPDQRGIKRVEGVSKEEILETLRAYGEYAAFLIRGEDNRLFSITGAKLEDKEFFAQEQLWEFNGGGTRSFEKGEVPEYVARHLTRLYLAKKKSEAGQVYNDLLGFPSPAQEYYARRLTEQYLNNLDVLDVVEPLPQGPGGEKYSRRDLVLEKFPGHKPAPANQPSGIPWHRYNYLELFRKGSVSLTVIKNPEARTIEDINQDYELRVTSGGELPAFANTRQLRGKLKKIVGDRRRVVMADRAGTPQAFVIYERERFTSRENPVTIRVEVHHLKSGEAVILHFTDASYREFLKTGRAELFERKQYEPRPASDSRSELRETAGPGREASAGAVFSPESLETYDVLEFLLGREGSRVPRESVPDLTLRSLKRFQAVLAGFTAAEEKRLRQTGGAEGLRRLIEEPGYEERLLAALTEEMARAGFVPGETLRPLFAREAARFIEGVRGLLSEEPAPVTVSELSETVSPLSAQGRVLLGSSARAAVTIEQQAAILAELKRANPGKYDTLENLAGVFGSAKENIPWMISLGNLQGHESSVTPEAKAFLEERFEKAGLDFGILYRVGTGQEAQVMALKEGFLKIWPVAARFGEPVKEGKLPAALRLGIGLNVLLSSDQRLDPAAEDSLVKAVHVAEDVVLADGFSAVEKIKITSLPLLNPQLEQQAPVLEGSRYRVVNRSVFNFLVDLINDLARIQSVQQIIAASA